MFSIGPIDQILVSLDVNHHHHHHHHFTRVSQIKEQLEAMEEDVENGEVVMTTLNGLPSSWDSYIEGICARIKLITFNRLWEECSQKEA